MTACLHPLSDSVREGLKGNGDRSGQYPYDRVMILIKMKILMKKYGVRRLLWSVAMVVYSAMVSANDSICYRVEASGTLSSGKFAPTWLTANRHGLGSAEPHSGYLRAGASWQHDLKRDWKIAAGLELAGGIKTASEVWIQQGYAELSWRMLSLCVGSKERPGYPLEKNEKLTSGWMVIGTNTRPIPQVRLEMKDYWTVPGTKEWFAFKGHIAYGYFADGNWQRSFVDNGEMFTQDVLLHSKSLMFRIGKKAVFPVEFEIGMMDAAQFAGDRMQKQVDGTVVTYRDMPGGFKSLLKAFIPKQKSTLQNIEGNHCGSWNAALTVYPKDWRVRLYLEHYFEDHSQMFFQYGRWKDGHLGLEITPKKNKWISAIVWEGMSTYDQTGPILYDGVGGSFGDLQMSGNDNYYNNGEYLGWQYYGATLGHPFLYGPQYNATGSNKIVSSRVKMQHIGISGSPTSEWEWSVLLSFSRQWGTYNMPLDRVCRQAAGLAEVTYRPRWASGWSVTAALAADRGSYIGDSNGGMLTIRKTGVIKW